MSTLASCGKLPATVPDLANRPRQLVFLTPIDSKSNDFLNEIHQIACREPSIVERIDEDLDLHAKRKSSCAWPTHSSWQARPLICPNCSCNYASLGIDDIELETGRPRTEAYFVYLFLMLRFGRRLQRPARPVVAAGVYHAKTLARTSGPGIAAGQHAKR